MVSEPTEELDSKVLGQLLLMQNVVINLPDEKTIFDFICAGVVDVPGIEKAVYSENEEEITFNKSNEINFPIHLNSSYYGHIHLVLSDFGKFQIYNDFLSNLIFMIGVILEQRKQREVIEQHQKDLEKKVEERTEQLNNEKQLLQSIVDNVPVMITIYDSEINTSILNKATENITGWTNEDAKNTNLMELAFPDPKNRQRVVEFMKAFKPEFKDFIMRTKDGRDIETSWANVKLADGRNIGVGVDISERKKMEQELLQAKEKAEEADKLKTAFLANMSHEIRTPMNGILGFLDILQDKNLSLETQKRYFDIIKKSGFRLMNTVNDIIEISKIESGQITLNKKEVDIINHLETLVTFFRPEAEKKGLAIHNHNKISHNTLKVSIDKTKLSSILSNLIKNAIKYTDKGKIEVGFEMVNNKLLFTCKDTGLGIPKNRQEAIFKRFEQADIDDKLAREGAGLGLSIVTSYLEMLGGRIWVESDEETGSTFFVELPFEPTGNNPHSTKNRNASIPLEKKKINILIAEDDEISCLHLKTIINQITDNIKIAKNGVQAVEMCKNDPSFDMVFMDIKMPQMDGYDAIKQIRKFNKEIVIVAQSAYAFEEDKQKALLNGCDDYISKPINKDALINLIYKYLRN